jgi:DNA-binding HxlR family transcriptional regulator
MIEKRSGCPINLAIEVLVGRWRLIVIRDASSEASLSTRFARAWLEARVG